MSKLRWLSALLLAVAIPAVAVAQERTTLTGTVTEAGTGQPLRNAQVTVRALNLSVPTDQNGRFTFQLRPGTHVVEVNMIGFKTVRRSISAEGAPLALSFALDTDPLGLDELVVVGYGEERRRKLTGSVASMRPDAVKEISATSVNQIMQGRLTGVQITQNSGNPGGAISVRVRGASSISGGNEPLYVVDGVPMTQGNFSWSGPSFGGQDVDAINDLSPNDIERIEILKDASAAAIYGSRASNGVVLITTKRGISNRPEISFGSYYGTQQIWREVDFLNAEQYMEVYNEGRTARFGPASAAGFDAYWGYAEEGKRFRTAVAPGTDTDWMAQVLSDAPIRNVEGSIRGGVDKVRYYVSGSAIGQDGTISAMGFDRITGRVNLDYQALDRLTLLTNISLGRTVTQRARNDDTIYGAFANATANPPIQPIFTASGDYFNTLYANPVGMLREAQAEERAIRILGNTAATYNVMNGLDARFSVGLDQLVNRSRSFDSPNFGPWKANGGMVSVGDVFINKLTVEGTVNFARNFGDAHEFSGVVGTSYEDNSRERNYSQSTQLPTEYFRYVSSGATKDAFGERTDYGLVSYFGRVSHTFNDKVTTAFNIRRDGSSRFGTNNRFGTFPSMSVVYRIGEESFMKSQDLVSNLALRVSYGRTGNQQDLGNFAARGLFAGGANYNDQPGIRPQQLENPDLRWETTDQLNVGTDFSILNDRLGLTIDYYEKVTNDLLVSRPVPRTTGYNSIWSNVGSMENKGYELAVRADLFRGGARGFNWTTSLSLAHNDNKVTELYNDQPIGTTIRVEEGKPLGFFFGYVTDGIFQTIEEVRAHATQNVNADPRQATGPGDIRFKDINGRDAQGKLTGQPDGVINDADRTMIGDPWADFEGGLNNTISFRNFDLTGFIQFSIGNDVLNGNRQYQDKYGSGGDNHTTRALQRWTPENPSTTEPRAHSADPNQNTRISNRFVEDGSYIRLKNLVLGYTLPASIAQKGGFRTARVYLQGQNVFTKTDYSGWDPEVNSSGQSSGDVGTITRGYDFYTLPQARTITFGINVGL